MTFFTVETQQNLPWYSFTTPLSGVQFTLRLRFNNRSSRWILDIADASDNDIIVGLPVLVSRDISGQYVTVGVPDGIFFCLDNAGTGEQPTLNSFGLTHSLIYEDPTT